MSHGLSQEQRVMAVLSDEMSSDILSEEDVSFLELRVMTAIMNKMAVNKNIFIIDNYNAGQIQ